MLVSHFEIFKIRIIATTFIGTVLLACNQVNSSEVTSDFYFHKSFGLIEIRDSTILHYSFPCVSAETWQLSGSSERKIHYYSTDASRFFCSGDPAPDTAFLSLEFSELGIIKLSSKCRLFSNGQEYLYLQPLGYDGGLGEIKDLTVYHGGYNLDPSETFSKSQLDSLVSKSSISLNLESALWMFFIGDTELKTFNGMTERKSVWMKLRFENGDEKMQEIAIHGKHCWTADFLRLLVE